MLLSALSFVGPFRARVFVGQSRRRWLGSAVRIEEEGAVYRGVKRVAVRLMRDVTVKVAVPQS